MWSLLVFVFAAFSAFFIPGDVLLKKLRLGIFERLVLGTVVGIVLFAFQGAVFGYLHIRWATYLYLIFWGIYWLVTNFKSILAAKPKLNFKNIDLILGVTILVGVLIQLSAVWNINVATTNGIMFCCRNIPDTIYHLSLTNELTKNFPPFEPGLPGVVVHNYHYWSNLVSAELVRIYGLPVAGTVYQYLALLVSLLVGGAGLVMGKTFGMSKPFNRWLIFFLYFFGDILFIFTAILGQGIHMNFSMLDDASQLLTGPPRAFSIAILFGGISLLGYWLKNKDFRTGFITMLVFSSLVGFKIYAAIFAFSGLGILGLYFLIKKDYKMLLPLIIGVFVSAVIYLPVNLQAGGFIFVGFWRFENFIVNPAFGLSKLELARLVYVEHGNWFRAVLLETFYIATYFIFLFGTSLIGFVQTKKSLSKFPKEITIFLVSGLVVTLILGMFFLQTTGGANTIQFILNNYFILAIFAALACSYWLQKFKRGGFLISVIVILFTVPRVLNEGIANFTNIANRNGYIVEVAQVDTLSKISRESGPDTKIALDPLMIYDNNYLYLSLLGKRPLYLAGIDILRDHGNIPEERIKSNAIIFKAFSSKEAQKTIKENNIHYLVCPADGCSGLISGKVLYNGSSVKIIEI